jgi:hypothetical protein
MYCIFEGSPGQNPVPVASASGYNKIVKLLSDHGRLVVAAISTILVVYVYRVQITSSVKDRDGGSLALNWRKQTNPLDLIYTRCFSPFDSA